MAKRLLLTQGKPFRWRDQVVGYSIVIDRLGALTAMFGRIKAEVAEGDGLKVSELAVLGNISVSTR